MVQYPAKPFLSNITGSYVFVPVDVRPERSFGIVGVNHFDIVDAQLAVNCGDGFLKAGRGRDIVTGCVAVAGIDTKSNRKIRKLGSKLPHDAKFFQPAAQRSAGARRIFEQHRQLPGIQTLRGLGQRSDDTMDTLFHRMSFAVSRMRHKVFGADSKSPLDLAAKCCNRLRAQRFGAGGKIDEVIVVDHQRVKIVPLSRPVQQLHFTLRADRGAPLPRAG